MKHPIAKKEKEFAERVIRVNRITRVVKGGRRLRFRATVAIGDHKGKIGLGVAKANEVADAVTKAVAQAKKNMVTIPIINDTIPHQIIGKFNAASVLLKPATPGTGVIAGGAVREIIEISGIKNIVSKIIGTTNKINCAKAAIVGLTSLRSKDKISAGRGIKFGKDKYAEAKAEESTAGVDQALIEQDSKTAPKRKTPIKAKKAKTDASSKSPDKSDQK